MSSLLFLRSSHAECWSLSNFTVHMKIFTRKSGILGEIYDYLIFSLYKWCKLFCFNHEKLSTIFLPRYFAIVVSLITLMFMRWLVLKCLISNGLPLRKFFICCFCFSTKMDDEENEEQILPIKMDLQGTLVKW